MELEDHLVVFQHGIWGTPAELSNIANALSANSPGKLRVLLSQACEGSTMDGVSAGGQRLATLIKEHAPKANGNISFVCHSLGGIYARAALRVLESEDWFTASRVNAINFVTTASPHLGVVEVGSFWRRGASTLGKVLGGDYMPHWNTVSDLMLQSDVLPELCDDIALRSLGRFERRAVYGNLDDDMWVRPCSALLICSQPCFNEELSPGHPHELAVTTSEILSGLGGASLSDFPAAHHVEVRQMLEALNTLSWERYIVHYPYKIWSGAAHAKICHHALEDANNDGLATVEHIRRSFLVGARTDEDTMSR
eukprot:TRINITY_DN26276_c0_g1_i1.p1 TRINITY_DN26276_c0_g1~~TRINITY_DN26276_c0_g1_i1.p1  ORF type:complete len:310 (+),score=31.22 TRINITY_DN26276_c0_g1_i1:284-1213(+)